MSCIYRPRCNQIWSIWYCVFVLGIHAYLVYLGVERYRLYQDMEWKTIDGDPNGGKPEMYLYIYIGLHALVIAASPFFIAFSLFKTGNLASDNERLGQRTERIVEMDPKTCCPRKFKSVWQHGPPAAQTVHLIMAFAILMAQQLMVAKLYEKDKLKSEDIFNTELDFLYGDAAAHRMRNILPHNLSFYHRGRHQDYALQKVSERNPKFLPLLVSQKLFGINLEFVNYFVALCAFAAVYPSVFWRASRCFSFIFSAQLMLWVFAAIFSYIDFEILFRIHLVGNPDRFGVQIPGHIVDLKTKFLLKSPYCILGSYLITTLAMFFASPILYGYGYSRYCISWQQMVQQRTWTDQHKSEDKNGIMKTSDSGQNKSGCSEYVPHLVAILLLVLLVGAKILVLYDTMLIFLTDWPHALSLTIVCVDVAYLFTWILLWLALTCKRTWEFKVTYTVPEILNLLHVHWAPGSGWSRYKKAVSEPSSAMVLMNGNEVFVTESPQQKTAIFRQANKFGMGSPKEEVYWLRPANMSGASPMEGRRPINPEGLDKNSPEMNRLLAGTNYQDPQVAGNTAYATRAALQQQQALRQQMKGDDARTMDNRGTGSYMRFVDVDAAGTPVYEDQQRTHDLATTFGTLPRGEHKRRRMLQGSDADFQYTSYNQGTLRGRQGSDGGGAYASIHKARPSPTPSGMQSTREYMRQHSQGMDMESNASRQSSYANIPGSRSSAAQRALQLQQMKDAQMRDPRAPPQARVVSVGNSRETSVGLPSGATMNSQQSTPQSSRAYIGGSQAPSNQNVYASVNGDNGLPQYASMTRIRQSPTSQRANKGIPVSQPVPEVPVMGFGRNGGPTKLSSFTDISKVGAPTTSGGYAMNQQEPIYGAGIPKPPSRELTPQSNASSTLTRNNQPHHYGPPMHQATVQQGPPSNQGIQWSHNPAYGNQAPSASSGHSSGASASSGYDHQGAAVLYGTLDNNITPTSTLTSQGSYTITGPGSPLESGGTTSASSSAHTYAALNGNTTDYHLQAPLPQQHSHPPTSGVGDSRNQGLRTRKSSNSSAIGASRGTLTATNGGSQYDRNDSANYSLTSSNESDPNHSQFATSIV